MSSPRLTTMTSITVDAVSLSKGPLLDFNGIIAPPSTAPTTTISAAHTHRAALAKALLAKETRRLALLKVSEAKEEATTTETGIAQMAALRQALGCVANRSRLFSTPLYCIDTAFSPLSYPNDTVWCQRGGLGAQDKVLDIGCGDGRAIIRAAKRGATAIGYEINEDRAKEAKVNVAAEPQTIQNNIQVVALNCIEVIDTQLADGITFVFLYLATQGMSKCLKYFRANPTALRVVSYINPFRESQKNGGQRIPCTKIWCESENAKEREMGVKFPIFCYTFGGDGDVGPSESKEVATPATDGL